MNARDTFLQTKNNYSPLHSAMAHTAESCSGKLAQKCAVNPTAKEVAAMTAQGPAVQGPQAAPLAQPAQQMAAAPPPGPGPTLV